MTDAPFRVLHGPAFHHSPLDNPVAELVESDFFVGVADAQPGIGAITQPVGHSLEVSAAQPFQNVVGKSGVQPFGMGRVHGVLHDLEVVARQNSGPDVPEHVVPGEQIPPGQQGRGQRPHVYENQPRHFLGGICPDFNPAWEGAIRRFGRHFQALAGLVEHPAVIRTPQTVLLGDTVGQRYSPVGANIVDDAVAALAVLVQDHVLA